MSAARGRVKDSQVSRVFLWAMRNINGEFERLFLREVISLCSGVGGWLFALLQEDFRRTTDHIRALVFELRVAISHFVPNATEGVVGQKLDDVPRRKELVSKSQFV